MKNTKMKRILVAGILSIDKSPPIRMCRCQ